MRYLRESLQLETQPEGAHAPAHRRTTLPLQDLQQGIHEVEQPQAALPCTLLGRRELGPAGGAECSAGEQRPDPLHDPEHDDV